MSQSDPGSSTPKPGAGHPLRAPWASPVDAGRLTEVRSTPPHQFVPPEPNDAAAFGWLEAANRSEGVRRGNGPTVTLARMCRHPRSQGSNIIGLPSEGQADRLVYLLEWTNVPMIRRGPAPSSGQVRREPEPSMGSRMDVVDAISGEPLFRRETNNPDPWVHN
jgi:hypothetical protein